MSARVQIEPSARRGEWRVSEMSPPYHRLLSDAAAQCKP